MQKAKTINPQPGLRTFLFNFHFSPRVKRYRSACFNLSFIINITENRWNALIGSKTDFPYGTLYLSKHSPNLFGLIIRMTQKIGNIKCHWATYLWKSLLVQNGSFLLFHKNFECIQRLYSFKCCSWMK